MRNLLKDDLQSRDYNKEARILAKAAKIVREDIFSHDGFRFNGTFPEGWQDDSSLLALSILFPSC